ncbi:MAG TPA: hypothetical protein PLG75_07460 [Methanoculleus sp.]|nr:hypothetical protein [Methanoculleus sp.]
MYGVASGLVETMRLLGMTASMAVTIIAFALFFKGMGITSETVPLPGACRRSPAFTSSLPW